MISWTRIDVVSIIIIIYNSIFQHESLTVFFSHLKLLHTMEMKWMYVEAHVGCSYNIDLFTLSRFFMSKVFSSFWVAYIIPLPSEVCRRYSVKYIEGKTPIFIRFWSECRLKICIWSIRMSFYFVSDLIWNVHISYLPRMNVKKMKINEANRHHMTLTQNDISMLY